MNLPILIIIVPLILLGLGCIIGTKFNKDFSSRFLIITIVLGLLIVYVPFVAKIFDNPYGLRVTFIIIGLCLYPFLNKKFN